jgi:hypothetical protein
MIENDVGVVVGMIRWVLDEHILDALEPHFFPVDDQSVQDGCIAERFPVRVHFVQHPPRATQLRIRKVLWA